MFACRITAFRGLRLVLLGLQAGSGLALLAGCQDLVSAVSRLEDDPALSKPQLAPLRPGEHFPGSSEADAAGRSSGKVRRGSPAFAQLVHCEGEGLVFKDEERTRADQRMTPKLRARLLRLSDLVARTWPGIRLRVTEAWDEGNEHGEGSLHYQGRAADLTTSDRDSRKLGKLAALAVAAELDWVFYEDDSHVHVSVKP